MKKENNDLHIAKFANVCNQEYFQNLKEKQEKQEKQEKYIAIVFLITILAFMIYTNTKWGVTYD